MDRPLDDVLAAYDADAPLAEASTLPGDWYVDPRVFGLEQRTVFRRRWQVVGRADQVREPGRFFTADVAGEPLVVARGEDGALRAFYNVCRHHAALVATQPEGCADALRCPYHGWTYGLDGRLLGAPDFDGVVGFERARSGLVPVRLEAWEDLLFVQLEDDGSPLASFLGELAARVRPLGLSRLRFFERRSYLVEANWKVYVDNYLDGGYHVPHLHRGLDSVLDYRAYAIETFGHACLQRSPLRDSGRDAATAAVRRGREALYFWLYPNLMINWYEGMMDTNRVVPLAPDRTLVVFDFYFEDAAALERNRASVEVSDRIQREDTGICASVQRGLSSRSYRAGRLSVRREAGEHLFHRLLAADLRRPVADATPRT